MLTTVPVHFIAYDQNGQPVAGAILRAKLDQTEIQGGFVVPEIVEVVADAAGEGVLDLWPNALGVAGSMYRVTATNPDTGRKFLDATASVPNSACELHQILVQEPYPAVDAAAQALIAAQGALAAVTAQAQIATAKAGEASSSANTAAGAASAAASSAISASASAGGASASAFEAAQAASAGGILAGQAQASADAAALSASAASASASSATTKASDASGFASAAQGSATAAGISAGTAATKASEASASASAASGSASGAATSAATAATKANEAGSSATAASNSAAAAASSAGAAGAAATTAAQAAEAIAAAVANKVDKIPGKGLSEADFTAAEKTKLADLSDASDPAKGAALVGFRQAGAGAAESSLRAELLRTYWAEQWGVVGDGITNNTINFANLAADLPGGAKVQLQPLHYAGNMNFSKSVKISGNGCRISAVDNSAASIRVGPSSASVTQHSVTESVIAYGDTQFNVVGADSLFNVGDIGVLWDSAVRPSDSQAVNYEVVKIKSISTNTVTVVGFINSYKGVGAIKFLHTPNQIKDVAIEDIHLSPPSTNDQAGVLVYFVDKVRIRRVSGSGLTGNCLYSLFCYDVQIEDVQPVDPYATGSGQGYGVGLFGTTKFLLKNIVGRSCRHVVDIDSAYDGEIDSVEDLDDQSAAVSIAHNGFAGNIKVRNVRVRTAQRAITSSAQGYGTSGLNPRRENHPFRNISIYGIECTFKSSVNANQGVIAVNVANSLAGICAIREIRTRFENSDALSGTASAAIRVDGVVSGVLNIDAIEGDKIGRAYFSNGNYGTGSPVVGLTTLRNIKYDSIGEVLRVQGSSRIDVDGVYLAAPLSGATLINVETGFSRNPQSLNLGANITYGGAEVQLFSATNDPTGRVNTHSASVGAYVTVTDGTVLTQAQVQNRLQLLRLVAPVGTGSITMGSFPEPLVNGIELRIYGWLVGRKDVIIPADAATFPTSITFSSVLPYASFIAYSGAWIRCA